MSHPIGVKVAPLSTVTTPTTAREIIDLCSKRRRFKAGDTQALQNALTRLETALPKHDIESGQEYYMQNRAHIRQVVGALAKKGFGEHAQRLAQALETADGSHFGWLDAQLRTTPPCTRRWQLLRTWQTLKDTTNGVVQQMLRHQPPDFVDPAPQETRPEAHDPRGVLGMLQVRGSRPVVGSGLLTVPGRVNLANQRPESQPTRPPPSPSFVETPDAVMGALFAEAADGPRLLRGATANALGRLRTLVQEAQDDNPRKFLEFVANVDKAVADYDEGWNSVAAVSAMWRALHGAACELEAKQKLSPAETAALKHLMQVYRDLYVSAVVDHVGLCYRGETHKRLLHRNAAYALLNFEGTRAVTSGYRGHFMVLRGAWVPPQRTPLEYVHANEAHLHKHGKKLVPSGSEWVPLAHVLLRDLQPSDFDRAPLCDFLTDQNFALLSCEREDHLTVVYRRAHELFHVEKPVVLLADLLEQLGQRQALPSHVKLTTHNGGQGATSRDRRTRTYDERWVLPLSELDARVVALQRATVQARHEAQRLHEEMGVHQIEDGISRRNAPWVEQQNLGNCSVHSQKLFLLYELQHPDDTPGLPLNAQEGTLLFAKLWERVMNRAYDACAHDGDADRAWLREMRSEVKFQKIWLNGLVTQPGTQQRG